MNKSGKVTRLGCLLAACAILATCTGTAGNQPAVPDCNMAIIASSTEASETNVVSKGMSYAINQGYFSENTVRKTDDPIPTKDFCYAVLAVSRTTLEADNLKDRLDYLYELYKHFGILPKTETISYQDAILFIDRMWKLDTDFDFDLAIQIDEQTELEQLNALHNAAGCGLIANDNSTEIKTPITYGSFADILARQNGEIARLNIQPSVEEKVAQNASEMPYEAIKNMYSSDDILNLFDEVALNSEYSEHASYVQAHNLVRWEKANISYSIRGGVTETIQKNIDEAIASINAVNGIPKLIYSPENSDLTIHVGTTEALQMLERYNASGFSSLSYDSNTGNIVKANVYTLATYDTEDYLKHVLYEEITQTFGLINDTQVFEESIFHDQNSRTTALADVDKLLLQMLYSDAVAPNMTPQDCRITLASWLSENIYK